MWQTEIAWPRQWACLHSCCISRKGKQEINEHCWSPGPTSLPTVPWGHSDRAGIWAQVFLLPAALVTASGLGHCQQVDVHLQCSWFWDPDASFYGVIQKPWLPPPLLLWLLPGCPRFWSVSGPGTGYISCSATVPGKPGGQRLNFPLPTQEELCKCQWKEGVW